MIKTILSVTTVILFLLVTSISYAANNQGGGANSNTNKSNNATSNQQNKPQQPVQNQNQVTTQNQGENQQLQVATQEQEGDKLNVSESASEVAKKVQQLLNTQTSPAGIGDQVREWAKTQDQTQSRIQEQIHKLDSKAGIVKTLFGPDYKVIADLKKEMEQNRLQTQQLEQLKLELTNTGEISNVQEMLTLMEQQRTTLQERLTSEENTKGIFGWLVKLFVK